MLSRFFRVSLLAVFLWTGTGGDRLWASHILGGEITYKCLGNGLFEFTVKVYRDCAGIAWSQNQLALQGPHGTTNLPLIAGSPEDISPRCTGNNYLSCNPPTTATNQNQGSVARYIFRGVINLSALGPAPATGYTFHTTQVTNGIPCCRPTIDNSTADNGSQTLVVKMFPYRNPVTNVPMSPAEICDNSPEFATDPTSFAILNPIDTIYMQSLAFDPDLDSTSFGIDFPLGTSPTAPYAYNNGFSQSNPIPGILGPPLVTAANTPVNVTTGEIVYKPTTQGTYVMVIKVASYRCNQLISEVYRDFNLKIIPNAPASPPVFNPSGPLGGIFSQRPPIIESPFPVGPGGVPTFEGVFYAGDTIESFVNVFDPFPSLGGNPNDPTTWVPIQQTVSVYLRGSQLATNFPAYNNCAQPPCARLQRITDTTLPPNPPQTPVTALNYGNNTFAGYGFTGTVQSGVKLVWPTDCANLPRGLGVCGVLNASNKFQVNAFDNNCPIEGREARIYTYKLLNVPPLGTVQIRGVSVAPTNDSVTIYWTDPLGGPPGPGTNPGALIDTVTIDPLDVFNYGSQTPAFQRAKSVARRKYSFKAYRLYRRPLNRLTGVAAGPWEKVDSLLLVDSDRMVDATPTLDLATFDYLYRVGVVSRCDSIENISDSLKVIRGELAFNTVNVTSTFTWDSMRTRNPYIPSNCLPRYYVQKQAFSTGMGNWASVDTFEANGNLPYVYRENTGIPCVDTVFFRAGLPDTNGTVYWSTAPEISLRQQNNIEQVVMERVSVDTVPNGVGEYGISMNWKPGPSGALGGYTVYHVLDSSTVTADSVAESWDYYDTSLVLYDYPDCDPTVGPVWLTVAGVDSCRLTKGSYSMSNYHNTMYNHAEYVYCSLERGMRLTWNHYYRWYPGIQKYRIYRSDEANPGYVLIDSVDKAPFDSLNSYTDKSDIPHQDIFRYVIEAVHSSGLTSLSSAGRDTVDNPVVRYNHIRKVSVDTATGLVNLKYIFNPFEIAKYYLLQRKTADLGYSTLDTFEFADLDFASGVPTIHYVDSTATPDRALYTYRMVVQDVCGVSIDTSGEFSNLFLYGEVDPFSYPKSATALKWEWVNNWPNDGEVFVVHRDVVRTGYPANFEPVYFIGSPVVRNHNDTVPQDPSTTALARFQYYLLAREENPNFEDFSIEELFSNRFALTHPPRLFTPTAFIPGLSNNGFFVPNGIFIDENKEFLLQVFNRWGQLQFETKDFGTSWDGTNKGKPCPQDTYVFRVLYTGRDEKLYDYNSSILLIRQE
jgi:gliding motility-associated-like protein